MLRSCARASNSLASAIRWTRPFTAAIKLPIEHWCIATNRVRYMGEPVAVVVCRSAQRREADHDAGEERRRDLQTAIPSTHLGSPRQPCNAEAHRHGARAHRTRDDAADKGDPEGGQRAVAEAGAERLQELLERHGVSFGTPAV